MVVRVQAKALKSLGYLVSTVSVLLLGIVAWIGIAQHPTLRLLLLGGMATAIAGMVLRWLSYREDKKS